MIWSLFLCQEQISSCRALDFDKKGQIDIKHRGIPFKMTGCDNHGANLGVTIALYYSQSVNPKLLTGCITGDNIYLYKNKGSYVHLQSRICVTSELTR